MIFQGLSCLLVIAQVQGSALTDRQNTNLNTLITKSKSYIPAMKNQVNLIDGYMADLFEDIKYGTVDISKNCTPYGVVDKTLQHMMVASYVFADMKNDMLTVFPKITNTTTQFSKIKTIVIGNTKYLDKRYNISSLYPQLKPHLKLGIFDETDTAFNQTKLNILINLIELWSDLEVEYIEKKQLIDRIAILTKCYEHLYSFTTFGFLTNPVRYYPRCLNDGLIRWYQQRTPPGFYFENGSVAIAWVKTANEVLWGISKPIYRPTLFAKWK